MAPSHAQVEQEEEEEEEGVEAHHPYAPSSELFDISTTVDPSYIISLIRKLLPDDVRTKHGSQDVDNNHASLGSQIRDMEQSQVSNSHHGDDTTDVMETSDDLTAEHRDSLNYLLFDQKNVKNNLTIDDNINLELGQKEENEDLRDGCEHPRVSVLEDPWEEYGCILWDLAANKNHAEFMVENLLLEVLLASLSVSKSSRLTEICLGIMGNLACHEVPRNHIASTNGLIGTIVDQLFLEDSPCLAETFRLLTLGLQGSGSSVWAEALHPEHILRHILWIAGNTLNSQLLEKSIELLLAIVDNKNEVASILLPPLMRLGLPTLLVDLLACEMGKLTDDKMADRDVVIDLILRVTEALSIIENYSRVISSNKELFRLVCTVVKFPDKVEVANSCVTAVVTTANFLTDEPDLASEISQDLPFLQGLLDIFPFVSDDAQARSALWSILVRVLVQVQENEMSPLCLQQYASVLISKSDLIEEDLDDHRGEDSTEDDKSSNDWESKLNARITSLSRIFRILDRWNNTRRDVSEKDLVGDSPDPEKVRRLMDYCHKDVV